MKFSCTQENLHNGLTLVSRVASRNVHLPILQNILITAEESGIQLTATNLEIGVRAHVRGKVEATGSVTVPAQVLSNYISLLNSERVDLVLEGDELVISAGSQHTKMKTSPAADFPLIPQIDRSKELVATSEDLKTALSQVLISTTTDDSRPELTGVYCSIEDKMLTMAATDSYRLSEKRVALLQNSFGSTNMIIPGQALTELSRMLVGGAEVKMHMSENQMLFIGKDVELTTRLIEGSFPDYREIIPKEFQTTVTVNTQELIRAIKASSIFSRSGIHDINLHFSADEQLTTLTSVNSQVGENISKVQSTVEGESNNTIFNYNYLLDGLQALNTETIEIGLVDNVTPGVFTPKGEGQNDFIYLIMPIKQ